jgi:glycosyltransferase involved in cell wall biosynthesis
MIKVGVVVSRIDRGAAELLEVNLAKSLVLLGYEVTLLPQFSTKRFDDEEIADNLSKDFGLRILRMNYDRPLSFVGQVFSAKRIGFDVLISHNKGTHLVSSIIAAIAPALIQIKGLHEYYFPADNCTITDRLWFNSVQHADYTYHISKEVLGVNIATFYLDPKLATVITNAIDFSPSVEFNFQEYSLPLDKKIILTVARVVINKGIENNLKIVAPILLSNVGTVYVIAGDFSCDQLYFLKMKDLAVKLGIGDQVFFIGQIKNVSSLMKSAHVLLHFANHEGFGLVLVEAILAKLPIVASDVGGIPEVLADTPYRVFNLSEIALVSAEVEKYLNTAKLPSFDADDYLSKYSYEKRAASISGLIKTLIKSAK